MKTIRKMDAFIRWARWYWWHTGQIFEDVRRGLDPETRRLLRERRWKNAPPYP